jgi:hypothetical protein
MSTSAAAAAVAPAGSFTAAKPVLNAKYNNLPTHHDPLRKGKTIKQNNTMPTEQPRKHETNDVIRCTLHRHAGRLGHKPTRASCV